MGNRKTNRTYKDRVFRAIFGSEERKEFTLSLYNALNNSNHNNIDDLTFNTLEDVIYVNRKNDVSFLFCDTYNLYEHQNPCNPNMPARGMMYFSKPSRTKSAGCAAETVQPKILSIFLGLPPQSNRSSCEKPSRT